MSLLETLEGNKTYIGGISAICLGICQFIWDWSQGSVRPLEYYATWLITGWTIIGARSAVKKR